MLMLGFMKNSQLVQNLTGGQTYSYIAL